MPTMLGLIMRITRSLTSTKEFFMIMWDEAIKSRVTELQFGRTSELIKSAVGALPVDMTIYIKHKRSLSNLILKNVIQSVKPSPFELRKPFKANFK